jgi:hypothetical protein
MTKTILVTLVLFHLNRVKNYQSVWYMKWEVWKPIGFDDGRKTSDERRAPFTGFRVILYLRAGTDSAQPIRVVRDSYVKG